MKAPEPQRKTERTPLWLILLLLVAQGAFASETPRGTARWSIEELPAPVEAISSEGTDAANLVLDDGTREADIGFGDTTAQQFLWLNVFDPASGGVTRLEGIRVLFPPSPEYGPGDPVQLVVYGDSDQDPANGAELLLAFDDVIQASDGTTFSSYVIDPPLEIGVGQSVLLGVVNRFVDSGVSAPSRPAALDTTTSQGRSYFALWNGDPPIDPTLPSDLLVATIDTVEAGNWMIRGVASGVPVVEVPTQNRVGLVALVLLLAAGGALRLRRSG